MLSYRAPLDDMSFALHDVAGLFEPDGTYFGLAPDDVRLLLDEAGRVGSALILPTSQVGDEQGCRFDAGRVTTPPALKAAFDEFRAQGWPALSAAEEHGGQGVPHAVGLLVSEIVTACSISFSDYAGLGIFAYRLLRAHGSEVLKRRYLSDLASARVMATMCMTEPHCGSDVGLLKTRAEAAPDGTYRISGTKIFISGGDHDLSENIVHFVLARCVGDPSGSKGISLFLVPKVLPGDGDRAGARNLVAAVGLEHKMGYAASATCQMAFDGATGWLVGKRGRGLAAMFTMVNLARLAVAQQGLALSEIAYQNAAVYALAREQGRSLKGRQAPDRPADPLIVHPDVRRILLDTRAFIDPARAMIVWLGQQIDIADRAPGTPAAVSADGWLALFTPVVKSVFSDLGFAACNACLQVFGGHGYIRATGMEQLVRDVRIAQIQEGANGMLATVLLRREIGSADSAAFARFLDEIDLTLAAVAGLPELTAYAAAVEAARDALIEATRAIFGAAAHDPDALGAAGVDYQSLFGLTAFGWFWLKIARAAAQRGDEFGRRKLQVARYFFERVLPRRAGYEAALRGGAGSIMAPDAGLFASAQS